MLLPTTSSLSAESLSAEQAARFLAQAAFGGTRDEVAALQAQGFEGWLDEQMTLPPSLSHWDWLVDNGYAVASSINNFAGVDNSLWRKLMSSPDVLRQRVTLALSELLVVSMEGLPIPWRGMAVAAYVDVLETHALGSYRQVLEAVTRSVAMGSYLSLRGNRKADGKGREPDENFARELMQLFTLGLVQLAPDGRSRTNAEGHPLETYDQADVMGLARALTGWDYDRFSRDTPDHARRPLVLYAPRHDAGSQRFLGTEVPAGTDGNLSLKLALDALFFHPNVGPFVGRQLVQRLVCSHPSPAYVGRVAAVFDRNAQGQRGDLGAVVRAVLLDPEARTPATAATGGRLREPVVRLVQWARTFGASSPSGLWGVGNLSNPANRLGQSPLRAPSVFNFFRPGYVPPGTALAAAEVTAPEFQLTNESTVVGYANFMQGVVANGVGDVRADYSPWLSLAADPARLVGDLNQVLAAGQLGADSCATIGMAVATMPGRNEAQALQRVQAAVWLVLCTPEYLVLK